METDLGERRWGERPKYPTDAPQRSRPRDPRPETHALRKPRWGPSRLQMAGVRGRRNTGLHGCLPSVPGCSVTTPHHHPVFTILLPGYGPAGALGDSTVGTLDGLWRQAPGPVVRPSRRHHNPRPCGASLLDANKQPRTARAGRGSPAAPPAEREGTEQTDRRNPEETRR